MAKICPKGIAWAKRTFDTYPSAYANLAASKYCKSIKCDEAVTAKAVKQFEDGQLGILVIEVQRPSEKIPEIEQTYSAGAVCLSLVNAGLAAGWGANWLTGWLSHDKKFVSEKKRLIY